MLADRPSSEQSGEKHGLGAAERDVVALGIAVAAVILFVGTAGTVMPEIVGALRGVGHAPNMLLTNAVLLNVALLIFGWRRYRDLNREIAERRKAEALAHELASRDPLTGCLNRRSGVPAMIYEKVRKHAAFYQVDRPLSAEVEIIESDLGSELSMSELISHAPIPQLDEFFALGPVA